MVRTVQFEILHAWPGAVIVLFHDALGKRLLNASLRPLLLVAE